MQRRGDGVNYGHPDMVTGCGMGFAPVASHGITGHTINIMPLALLP